jgi:hypothetical protein
MFISYYMLCLSNLILLLANLLLVTMFIVDVALLD